jgi:hypothetical protein
MATGESSGPVAGLKLALGGLPDLERGITRVFHRTVSPAEFATVMRALSSIRATLGFWVSFPLRLRPDRYGVPIRCIIQPACLLHQSPCLCLVSVYLLVYCLALPDVSCLALPDVSCLALPDV